jgi:hypothetical protein
VRWRAQVEAEGSKKRYETYSAGYLKALRAIGEITGYPS